MVHRQLNLPPPSLRDTTMSTPTQQKALFLQAKRGDFAVGTREVPKPGPGDILVQNTAVGINALEWKIQAFGIFVENYPAILGLDAAGVVEDEVHRRWMDYFSVMSGPPTCVRVRSR